MTSRGAFALLPAEDVPETGSRTEVLVSPTRVLRVEAFVCGCGQLSLQSEPLGKNPEPMRGTSG